jgi:hypothetical protein
MIYFSGRLLERDGSRGQVEFRVQRPQEVEPRDSRQRRDQGKLK